MRDSYRKRVVGLLVAALCLLSTVAIVQGQNRETQNREKLVISAKAGGVNAVSGTVTVKRRAGSDAQLLSPKDALNSGDLVQTGSDGRVEVLLNPGSYLRVMENSEFELADASLDGLRLRLLRGSAIIEAATADDVEILIQVETPQTRIAIVKGGLYRLNVGAQSGTELLVRKGRAEVGGQPLVVKGGRKVLVGAGRPLEALKFDKKDQDEFDNWSKERAETLAQANRKLSRRSFVSLYSSMDYDYWSRFEGRGRYGFWLFNPLVGMYTFVPFYFGWGSPYGRSYSSSFYEMGWRTPWYGRPIKGSDGPVGGGNGGPPQRVGPPPNRGGGERPGGDSGPGPRPARPYPGSGDDGGGIRRVKPSNPDMFRGGEPSRPMRQESPAVRPAPSKVADQ